MLCMKPAADTTIEVVGSRLDHGSEFASPTVVLRKAVAEDASDLMAIRLSVRENSISRSRLEELGITEASMVHMLQYSHFARCAEVDGRLVGFSMADNSAGSIFALFVLSEFEGKGIGSQLLEAAVHGLRLAGHARVTLSTEPQSRAFGFYT